VKRQRPPTWTSFEGPSPEGPWTDARVPRTLIFRLAMNVATALRYALAVYPELSLSGCLWWRVWWSWSYASVQLCPGAAAVNARIPAVVRFPHTALAGPKYSAVSTIRYTARIALAGDAAAASGGRRASTETEPMATAVAMNVRPVRMDVGFNHELEPESEAFFNRRETSTEGALRGVLTGLRLHDMVTPARIAKPHLTAPRKRCGTVPDSTT
jgi:hypothetical protein